MAKKIDHQSEDCNTSAVKGAAGSSKNVEKCCKERNQPSKPAGRK